MVYLVVKMLLLLAIAAVCGFFFGQWWLRRRFRDVTQEHWRLSHLAEEPKVVDYEPKFQELFGRLEEMQRNPRGPLPPANPGFIEDRLRSLDVRIAAMRPVSKTDVIGLLEKMSAMEKTVRGMSESRSGIEPMNLASFPAAMTLVSSRLSDVEETLKKISSQLLMRPTASRGPGLLAAASYGVKDDLKRISGVGPKLENLLNEIGVFYFWQVAGWSPQDIEEVDKLLDMFKGRIERDEWVLQAQSLAATSPSRPPAAEPAEPAEQYLD